jgi:phosphoserine aminotransferase
VEKRIFNFSAGPATLPLPVLEQVQKDLVVYPGAGMSVMEMSHRSKAYSAIHQSAKDHIKTLLKLPDDYHVLFVQGGATLQFTMLAANFLQGQSADYIACGSWASKAIDEAKIYGTPRVCWNGKAEKYVRMPTASELDLDPNAQYVHTTSNETIQGIEFFEDLEVGGKPLFCDSSSDFLARPVDISKYALFYAGAQKNVGPSGLAVVIIRDDMLAKVPAGLPSLLDYKVMVENDSLYNTPPCFGIYMVAKVTEWILNNVGGLEAMEALNRKKANLLYDVIDNSGGYYRGHAQVQNRSIMNVTFVLPDEEATDVFVKESTAAGLDGLRGHRSVGGCRASIYNAMPLEGVEALANFMVEFQKKRG